MPQKVDSGANRYKWPLFTNSGQIIRVSDRLGGIPIIGLIIFILETSGVPIVFVGESGWSDCPG